MTPLRDQVVAAFENGDEVAIRRLDWFPVWEALATWWAPRQTCNAREAVPFAKLLGDEEPDKILEAFRELAGDWRPHPAAVRGYLHRAKAEPRISTGAGRDPAATDAAIRATADALRAGEQPCACLGRAATWAIDGAGVLRCREPKCRGLEWGQVFAAEDAEPESMAAA